MHIILIYIGILAGIFFEGEMVMISAVLAAHKGYISLWLVIAIGVLGTYGSDQFYFFLGRKKGKEWLQKNEKLTKKVNYINLRLEKYPVFVYIIYRFMYGFRTITPLVIGVGKVRTSVFMFYSAVSTLLWAAVYSTLGYLFGEFLRTKLSHIEHVEEIVLGIIGTVAIIAIVYSWTRKHRLAAVQLKNEAEVS